MLQDGEAFVLDAAPIVHGFPADFAYSGLASGTPEQKSAHTRLLLQLTDLKRELLRWVSEAASGGALCERAASAAIEIARLGCDPHSLPRAGAGPHAGVAFSQLVLVGTAYRHGLSAVAAHDVRWPLLVLHHLAGTPYPGFSMLARRVARKACMRRRAAPRARPAGR